MSLVPLATMDHATVDAVSCAKLLLPPDRSLLTTQDSHVTNLIWGGKFRDYIRPNDHSLSFSGWKISEAQTKLLKKSGFYKMSLTGYVHLDSHLLTAVLDRWRPETNTFHFPFGEMTVTLEDVAFILGLPVSGKVVCGSCPENPRQFVKKMLGEYPKLGSGDLAGNRLRLTWLRRTFQGKKNIKTEAQIVKATRAYILYLLGSTIFSDSGTGYVHIMYLTLLDNLEEASSYAWGAAGLAYLYRSMTKAVTVCDGCAPINLCGSFTLLMCWIFEHIPLGRPKYQVHNQFLFPLARKWNQAHVFSEVGRQTYLTLRPLLDQLRWEEVTFRPYRNFPKPCKLARRASRYGCVDVVLTVFHVIAAYNPSRCMPQFGMVQGVPRPPTPLKVSYTSRPSPKMNYQKRYSKHIRAWDAYVKDPKSYVLSGEKVEVIGNTTLSYKDWYERVAIRRVNPYTISEAKQTQEYQILREVAAEYSLLTEPYLKQFLKDKRNRIAKLFKILEPYQHLLARKAQVSEDSYVSCWRGEIPVESAEHAPDHGESPEPVSDCAERNESQHDCVESAEGELCVRREEVTHACNNCDSGELCVDHSVVLHDSSAAGMSCATMDSIRIDDEHHICCLTEQAQERVNGESTVFNFKSMYLENWNIDNCGPYYIESDEADTADDSTSGGFLLSNANGSQSKASLPDLNVCIGIYGSIGTSGGGLFCANADGILPEARLPDLNICTSNATRGGLMLASAYGRHTEASLPDLNICTTNDEAGREDVCVARLGELIESDLIPESIDLASDEAGDIMKFGLQNGKITESDEMGCFYTTTPAVGCDGESSKKKVAGPKGKRRRNGGTYVFQRRATKSLKSGLVVRHDTRSTIPADLSDEAPNSHDKICALPVPYHDSLIKY